jgi:hypothetical protein
VFPRKVGICRRVYRASQPRRTTSSNIHVPRGIPTRAHECFFRHFPLPGDRKLFVMAEWLPFLLRFWEVPGSNIDLQTDYSEGGLQWLSPVPPNNCRVSRPTLNQAKTTSFHVFPIRYSPYHSATYNIV